MGALKGKLAFAEKFSSNVVPVGSFVMSTDAAVTGMCGVLGYDFVIIDREHGPNDTASTLGHIRAADANGTLPLVRVLENNAAAIQSSLDLGAHGVVVPKVSSAADAERALAATRYGPRGRGACPVVEAARWTEEWPSYAADANAHVLMVPLIETEDGVEHFEDIVAIEGVDLVLVGFGDLAQDLGMTQQSGRDTLARIWGDCLRVGHQHGVKVGCNVGPAHMDADFFTLNSDLRTLTRALREQLSELRSSLDARS